MRLIAFGCVYKSSLFFSSMNKTKIQIKQFFIEMHYQQTKNDLKQTNLFFKKKLRIKNFLSPSGNAFIPFLI